MAKVTNIKTKQNKSSILMAYFTKSESTKRPTFRRLFIL